MNWPSFVQNRYLLKISAVILILFFLFFGCSSRDAENRDRAIALVQNYQIGGKSVNDRLSYALLHSTNEKINTIEWNASRTNKNIYEVTCTAKVGNREIFFKWLANLSSKRITPLNMTTQDVMGGGFY